MTANEQAPSHHEIILYSTPDGAVRVEVAFEGETFWLTQRRMADLFGVGVPTISHHLKLIFYSLGMPSARKLLISLRAVVEYFKM